jgi:polysaccharide export outer membrane protein
MYKSNELGEFLRDTARPQQENQYIIAQGDRLDVVFFVHKDLSTDNLLVRSDGRITLPYVGDVMAAGNTPSQLDSILTVRFSEVLREPNLSVIITNRADKSVYVLGQVARPGGFTYETSISVLQAVAEAGGFVDGAKSDHAVVIRREGLDRIVGVEVNLAAITSGHAIQNDFWLRNYDIVYVPKTPLRSLADFVQTVDDILQPPIDIIFRGWQIKLLRENVRYVQINNP